MASWSTHPPSMSAARESPNRYDFALVAMLGLLGLLGLRIFGNRTRGPVLLDTRGTRMDWTATRTKSSLLTWPPAPDPRLRLPGLKFPGDASHYR